MKRGKILSFIRKGLALAGVCVCVFTAGYIFGVRNSVMDILSAAGGSEMSVSAPRGGYTAILSGKWIYVYDGAGALCDTVYVCTEYMTEEDKAALSDGLEFENEADMREFIEAFE